MSRSGAHCEPGCPRCGYDLSGTIAGWTRSCPLAGNCPECGLSFEWSRVFALARHSWLIEYRGRRRPLDRLWKTWLGGLFPWRFWRDANLADPVRLRPAGLLVAGLALAVLIGLFAWIYIEFYSFVVGSSYQRFRIGAAGHWLNDAGRSARALVFALAYRIPGPLVALAAMPLAFASLHATLGKARVRPAQILRIWLYSLLAPLTLAGLWVILQVALPRIGLHTVADMLHPWTWARALRRGDPSWLGTISPALPGLAASGVCVAWLALWWACACRLYLRLDQTGRIVGVLAVMVLLAAVTTQLWVWLLWPR
ncbi:MAG: hypothetical protein ACYS0G_02360 [Planctomycetota bacterium]